MSANLIVITKAHGERENKQRKDFFRNSAPMADNLIHFSLTIPGPESGLQTSKEAAKALAMTEMQLLEQLEAASWEAYGEDLYEDLQIEKHMEES